jgi:hypothetical protein
MVNQFSPLRAQRVSFGSFREPAATSCRAVLRRCGRMSFTKCAPEYRYSKEKSRAPGARLEVLAT